MRVLYIGGTGEISLECVKASTAAGHHCTVFNRGRSGEKLPDGIEQIVGDVSDPVAYGEVGRRHFDVVCQFKAYTVAEAKRDLEIFSGKTGQYVFISSASAYRKPPLGHVLTEDVPLGNPYWPYSQAKADMEALLFQSHRERGFPLTVVRPSHTYRTRFPSTFVPGDLWAWRMLNGRPILSHADGQSLWTLTHSSDFAPPFVKLLGNARSIGQAFQLTGDRAYTWDEIFRTIARVLGVAPRIVHVPTDTLIRYNGAWTGSLLGDKGWTTLFDNSKIKSVTGEFQCCVELEAGVRMAEPYVRKRLNGMAMDEGLNALLDRIAAEQEGLGR